MSSESRLLISIARGNHLARQNCVPSESIDEQRLLRLANKHQVAALAYWNLRNAPGYDGELGGGPLRKETMAALKLSYLQHLMRNESLVRDLEAIDQSFRQQGVEFMVFKGPWLAFHAYPDPGARPIGDIDLGVHEQDLSGAVQALAELGYRPETQVPADPQAALQQAHFGSQLRFTARGRRMVELHFRMINFGPPAPEENWLWESAAQLRVGSSTIQVPDQNSMLLHLALHANQHGFGVLRLLFDLKFALERSAQGLELDLLLEHVRRLHCHAAVYHSLLLASELTGAPVPTELLVALQPGRWRRRLFERVWDLPGARNLSSPRRAQEFESPRLYLCELGTPLEKLRYLSGIIREAGGPLQLVKSARKISARPSRRQPVMCGPNGAHEQY